MTVKTDFKTKDEAGYESAAFVTVSLEGIGYRTQLDGKFYRSHG